MGKYKKTDCQELYLKKRKKIIGKINVAGCHNCGCYNFLNRLHGGKNLAVTISRLGFSQ